MLEMKKIIQIIKYLIILIKIIIIKKITETIKEKVIEIMHMTIEIGLIIKIKIMEDLITIIILVEIIITEIIIEIMIIEEIITEIIIDLILMKVEKGIIEITQNTQKIQVIMTKMKLLKEVEVDLLVMM